MRIPPYFGAPATVSYGMKGSDVQALQQDLSGLDYSVAVDGVFGDATLAAVKQFQSDSGLPVTGIADAATWAALSAGSAMPLVPLTGAGATPTAGGPSPVPIIVAAVIGIAVIVGAIWWKTGESDRVTRLA